MANSNNILVITKNGNFVAAVGDASKAEAKLRELLIADLKLDPGAIKNAKAETKNGVMGIAGTPYYRAKETVVS